MPAHRFVVRPRVAVACIAAVSAAAHALLALRIHSILYFPDEWLYAGLSRSVFHGVFGQIHGSHVPSSSTISYVGPVLTSPLWLLHDVSLAHHLSQAVASAAFGTAAFPAYLLGRRLRLGAGAAVVGAALSQLVPAGVFTATLLAEPYAYPVFLAAVVLALDAARAPGPRRVAALAVASVALLLTGGLQFLVFPVACLAAWVAAAPAVRSGARRAAAVAAALLAVLALAAVAGGLGRVWVSARSFHYPAGSLLAWLGVNALVLAVATGWVVVPVALVGVGRSLRSPDDVRRTFAWLTAFLAVGFLCEAAIWGANGNGLYERFTFYATPLLLLAFLGEASRGEGGDRRPYAALAYAAAAAALLVPLTSRISDNEGHSPTMLALADGLLVRLQSPSLVWAPLLAVLAVVAAAVGRSRPRLLLALGAGLIVCTTASAARSLTDYDSRATPRVAAPGGATLLASPVTGNYEFALQRFLFWNPEVDRVLVLGGGSSPDGLAAPEGRLVPPHTVAASGGGGVAGPFVVAQQTSAWRGDRLLADGGPGVLAQTPDTIAFGWGRNGVLAPVVELFAAGDGAAKRRLSLQISSAGGRDARYAVRCTSGPGRPRLVDIGPTPTRIAIDVPARGSQRCRLSLVDGDVATAVRAHLAVERAPRTGV